MYRISACIDLVILGMNIMSLASDSELPSKSSPTSSPFRLSVAEPELPPVPVISMTPPLVTLTVPSAVSMPLCAITLREPCHTYMGQIHAINCDIDNPY